MKKQFFTYVAGLLAGLTSTLSTPVAAQSCPGTTVAGGTSGTGAAQFNYPTGVAVDGAGNIYVVDQFNHRIQRFAPGSTAGSNGTTVAGITGSYGSGTAELNYPTGVAVDGAGNIYVADRVNNRIQKFAPGSTEGTNGTTVAGTGDGTSGSGDTELNTPVGVAVDGAGNIYVADVYNQRIQKFAPSSTQGSSGTTVAGDGTSGSGPAQLSYPYGVAVDGAGNIYVADQLNQRIRKFIPQPAAASLGSLTADETGCPVRLRVTGNGQQFVFTGPQGYVFSQVYRTRGDYQPVAIDVRQPGTYRLTADVSGGCGNSTAVQTVTVTRSCP